MDLVVRHGGGWRKKTKGKKMNKIMCAAMVAAVGFGVYNAAGTKIGRVLTHEDFSSLSNWVERVFMKK